jgi:type I restriction enzyme S subunit
MVHPNIPEYENLLHIGPDRIEKNTGKLLPALTAKEEMLISKKFFFTNEYILYSKIRPYLNKVAMPSFSGLCSADMYPVKPIEEKVNRAYLWKLLLSTYFIKYTETLPDRASIPKLNKKELVEFAFPLPPLELQNIFASIVEKIETIKEKENQKLKQLEDLHNSLMQKAFKGEIQ